MEAVGCMERGDLSGDLADLADELGIDVARKVFIQWRGCCLNIPNRLPKRTMQRYIITESRRGRSLRELARELNVGERYVQRVLRAAKCDEAQQLLLFPDAESDPA